MFPFEIILQIAQFLDFKTLIIFERIFYDWDWDRFWQRHLNEIQPNSNAKNDQVRSPNRTWITHIHDLVIYTCHTIVNSI